MFSDKLMLTVYVLVLSDTLTLNFVFWLGDLLLLLSTLLSLLFSLLLSESMLPCVMTHPSYVSYGSNNDPLTLSNPQLTLTSDESTNESKVIVRVSRDLMLTLT